MNKEKKVQWNDSFYQDYDEYYQFSKKGSEEVIKRNLANLACQAEKDWESFVNLAKMINELNTKESSFKVSEYLARQSFYRQNNLPAELNLLIEKFVDSPSEYYQMLKEAYLRTTKPCSTYTWIISMEQGNLNDLETNYQAYLTNIQEALNSDITQQFKEEQLKIQWELYLATKTLPENPLPSLPEVLIKKENKLKNFGNKIKTQFQQLARIKQVPIKSINNSLLFNLVQTSLFFRK